MSKKIAASAGQAAGRDIDNRVTVDVHLPPVHDEPAKITIGTLFSGPVHIHVTVGRDDLDAK